MRPVFALRATAVAPEAPERRAPGDGSRTLPDPLPVMETAADGTYGFVLPAGGTYSVRRSGQVGWLPPGTQSRTVQVNDGEVVEAAPFAIIAATALLIFNV